MHSGSTTTVIKCCSGGPLLLDVAQSVRGAGGARTHCHDSHASKNVAGLNEGCAATA